MLRYVVLVSVILQGIYKSEATEVTWLSYDFPPYYILEGANKGKGRDQMLIDEIHRKLPTLRAQWKNFPTSRLVAEMSNTKKNYCAMSMFKSEQREQNMYMSKQFSTVSLPPKILVKKGKLQTLGYGVLANRVSIIELLEKHNMSLGVSKGRSYGKALDSILQSSKYEDQIFTRSGVGVSENLLKMLQIDRIQMILGYVEEHKYHSETSQLSHNVEVIELTEEPFPIYGYIGCSKNAWGRGMMSQINTVLKDFYKSDSARDAVTYWLPENFHREILPILLNEKLR